MCRGERRTVVRKGERSEQSEQGTAGDRHSTSVTTLVGYSCLSPSVSSLLTTFYTHHSSFSLPLRGPVPGEKEECRV